ncbi:MAG: hypothetical protein GY952_05595 [Rhodobacteraceae bacterium]|nr:hypothetical protein [Paracoccaceae bacterium]
MLKWFKKSTGFRKDERGYTSVEFVIVATTFLMAFFWVFETGLIMAKQMMLEQALDRTVRDLRLSSSSLYTHDYIKDRICDYALILQDCGDNLVLEADVYDMTTGFPQTVQCVDKENEITPITTWETGQRSEIVYLRACVIIDPMMPNGIALFPGASASGIPLFADSAFANEPA